MDSMYYVLIGLVIIFTLILVVYCCWWCKQFHRGIDSENGTLDRNRSNSDHDFSYWANGWPVSYPDYHHHHHHQDHHHGCGNESYQSTSQVVMWIITCALHTCLQSKERDCIPPDRTNDIPTIPAAPPAPNDDFSRSPVTYTSPEFQHLFPTDRLNILDRDRVIYHSNNDQRIPSNNNQSRLGFVYPSTRRDYGFNHPSNIGYGFIYPTDDDFNRSVDAINDHANIHDMTYSSINSEGINQPASCQKPSKNIETPPPSYYKALLGYNSRDYINQQNRITCERCKAADRNGSGNRGGASGGGSDDGMIGSVSNSEAPVVPIIVPIINL